MLKKQNILFPFCPFFQIGSSIACGSGVKLSKFYYYDDVTDSCQAEIACPVPIEDTSRGNRFFSRISCLKLCKKPNQVKTEQNITTPMQSGYGQDIFSKIHKLTGKTSRLDYQKIEKNILPISRWPKVTILIILGSPHNDFFSAGYLHRIQNWHVLQNLPRLNRKLPEFRGT